MHTAQAKEGERVVGSTEKQRRQLVEDYTYIRDQYGAPDAAETHQAMWDAVTGSGFTKAHVNDVLRDAIELAFQSGVGVTGGWMLLPVDEDERLQQIKGRLYIDPPG